MALRRPLLLPRFHNYLRRKFCNGSGGSDIKKLFVEELSKKLNAVGTLQQKKKENVYKNAKEPVRSHAHKNRTLELKEIYDLESALEKNSEWTKINQNKKKEKKTSAKMEQKKEEENVPSRLKVEDVYNEISNAQYGTTVKKIVDIARKNGLKTNKLYRTGAPTFLFFSIMSFCLANFQNMWYKGKVLAKFFRRKEHRRPEKNFVCLPRTCLFRNFFLYRFGREQIQ